MITAEYYIEGINEDTLTEWELQARLVFSVIVAGKNAKFARNVISKLFVPEELPFTTLRRWIWAGKLEENLRRAGSGNYGKMTKCFPELIRLDPRSCALEELESVNGIGPKTARFYLLWIGRKIECAALDVHILKFLRKLGYNAPKTTPTGRKYMELEKVFLNECKLRKKTPNELDAEVWLAYSTKDEEKINALYSFSAQT